MSSASMRFWGDVSVHLATLICFAGIAIVLPLRLHCYNIAEYVR
jgi:hypothetical protein